MKDRDGPHREVHVAPPAAMIAQDAPILEPGDRMLAPSASPTV